MQRTEFYPDNNAIIKLENDKMKLIPIPKVLRQFSEIVTKRAVFCDCKNIDDRLVKAIHKLPNSEFGLPLTFHIGNGTEESYTLDISNNGIVTQGTVLCAAQFANHLRKSAHPQ